MCNQVYLAADRPLREVAWQPEAPGFHVQSVARGEQRNINRMVRGEHLFRAGSWMGCGCGFNYSEAMHQSADDRRRGRESVAALRAYLSEAVQGGPVEVLHCWVGGEIAKPARRIRAGPAVFGGDEFRLGLDTVLYVVSSE